MTTYFSGVVQIVAGLNHFYDGGKTLHFSEIMQSFKCFPHVSKIPTLRHTWMSTVVIENALILNMIHYIFKVVPYTSGKII
jgi:hypothetical protein